MYFSCHSHEFHSYIIISFHCKILQKCRWCHWNWIFLGQQNQHFSKSTTFWSNFVRHVFWNCINLKTFFNKKQYVPFHANGGLYAVWPCLCMVLWAFWCPLKSLPTFFGRKPLVWLHLTSWTFVAISRRNWDVCFMYKYQIPAVSELIGSSFVLCDKATSAGTCYRNQFSIYKHTCIITVSNTYVHKESPSDSGL